MILGLQKIPNAYTFEIPVGSAVPNGTGTKYPFPDIPQIRGRKVVGMCVYDADAVALTMGNRAVIGSALTDNVFVTLVDTENFAFVDTVPFNFYNLLRYGQPLRNFVPGKELNTQRCYFELSQTTSPIGAFLVTLFYE